MMTLKAITKVYSSGFKLEPCSMQIKEGETLSVLGKNGSGKSTLLEILTANSDPSTGEIFFAGERLTPEAYMLKRKLGYLPQNTYFPMWVSGRELLAYASRLYQLPIKETVKKALAYWDSVSYQHKPLAVCSHGMQKRIGLAMATLNSPSLLVLDEPFSGLDVMQTKALENILQQRKDKGLSNVISTHILPYVAKISDRVLILKQGRSELLRGWQGHTYLEKIDLLEHELLE